MVAGKKATKLLGHSKTRAGIVQRPQGRFNNNRQEWSAKKKTDWWPKLKLDMWPEKQQKQKRKPLAFPPDRYFALGPKTETKKKNEHSISVNNWDCHIDEQTLLYAINRVRWVSFIYFDVTGDMTVPMRKLQARPWVGVRVCHLLLLFVKQAHAYSCVI